MASEDKPVILAVDDCEELLDWLKIDLASRGYGVETAPNGREALEIVGSTPIDIMILDVMMPGSARVSNFLMGHPLYRESSSFRLDVGLTVRQEGRVRPLPDWISEGVPLCPPLDPVDGATAPKMVQEADRVEMLDQTDLAREVGGIRLSFDGFSVCQLITSNRQLPRRPTIYLFTAGGPGPGGIREKRAALVGASAYILKNEYYGRLIPLIEQFQRQPAASSTEG